MGIKSLVEEISELNKGIHGFGERILTEDELKDLREKRAGMFGKLKEACINEGIVALVNGEEWAYVRAEQISVWGAEGAYVICEGNTYSINSEGRISRGNLSNPKPYFISQKGTYRHYSMLAPPKPEHLNILSSSPDVDLLFKLLIEIYRIKLQYQGMFTPQ